MREFLLYGIARGETRDYMETLLYSGATTLAQLDKVKQLAADNGFHSFRVATYNGEAPNFAKAVNV